MRPTKNQRNYQRRNVRVGKPTIVRQNAPVKRVYWPFNNGGKVK